MHDPKPLLALLIVQGLVLLWLLGWWLGLPPADRLQRLLRVAQAEAIALPPPATLVGQAAWLYTHRRTRLIGMAGVLGVAGLVGIGEGIARRRQDVLGGFLFFWWVVGGVGLALLPGAGSGYLIAPWPLEPRLVAGGLAGLVGVTGYALACGRPYIP